jgi:hypothetical protein
MHVRPSSFPTVDWELKAMAKSHEERISELEQEVEELRSKVEALEPSEPWWERIAGTFEKDPIYEKAMKLGREYRKAQRPGAKGANEK